MVKRPLPPVEPVPRLAPGGVVVCVATGPSLTREDVDYCRDKATAIIAVNDAYRWAPFADALVASDAAWWQIHHGAPDFPGRKYALEPRATRYGAAWLRRTGTEGIERDPTGLRSGHNSGYAALNVAVHFGAARILLLGYDMQRGRDGRLHFFGLHPRPLRNTAPFPVFRRAFATAVAPLQALGITVVNCTPSTALTMFPQCALREALPAREVAA